MTTINLEQYGIQVREVSRNPSPAQLYCDAIRNDPGCDIAESGALIAYSAEKTGRSPKDKRIVKHPDSEADVWWEGHWSQVGNLAPTSHDFFGSESRSLSSTGGNLNPFT